MKIINKILAGFLILLIKIYQRVISPFFPASCRYWPTCSQYGIEAIKKHGPFKGFYYTFRRVITCHPWGGSGYDPVP